MVAILTAYPQEAIFQAPALEEIVEFLLNVARQVFPVVCEMLILYGNRILVQSITVCFPTITLQLSNFFISVFI